MAVLIIPARSSHTHGQAVGDEFVVLNHATKAVHHLEGAAAAVWAAAGSRIDATVDIRAAVDQLCLLDLLETPAGVSRRSMLKRTGVIAAGVGIASMALPMADAAASLTAGNQMISLDVSTGSEGTLVTVTGSGFFGPGTLTVTIGGITVTPSSNVIASNGTVNFTFVVPNGLTPVGSKTVAVTDNHHNTATATFNLTTGIAINPPNLPRGGSPQTVAIGGNGFTPGSTITISNAPGGDFNTVTGGPFIANAAGEIPAGSQVTITYGNGSGSDKVQASDGTHTFLTPTINH